MNNCENYVCQHPFMRVLLRQVQMEQDSDVLAGKLCCRPERQFVPGLLFCDVFFDI